jgi:hypothetical protein
MGTAGRTSGKFQGAKERGQRLYEVQLEDPPPRIPRARGVRRYLRGLLGTWGREVPVLLLIKSDAPGPSAGLAGPPR